MIVAYQTMVAETTALFASASAGLPVGADAERGQLAQQPEPSAPEPMSVCIRCKRQSRAVFLRLGIYSICSFSCFFNQGVPPTRKELLILMRSWRNITQRNITQLIC